MPNGTVTSYVAALGHGLIDYNISFGNAGICDGGLYPLLPPNGNPSVDFNYAPFTVATAVRRAGFPCGATLYRATVHAVAPGGVTLRRGGQFFTLDPDEHPALQTVRKGKSVRVAVADGIQGVERVTHRRSKLV